MTITEELNRYADEVGLVKTVFAIFLACVIKLTIEIIPVGKIAFDTAKLTEGEYSIIVLLCCLIFIVCLMYIIDVMERILKWFPSNKIKAYFKSKFGSKSISEQS